MNISDISRLRAMSHGLYDGHFKKPADVARHLVAMQAQDFPGAKWSVGLRLSRSSDEAVTRALVRGEIIRTWPMRGTLHFLAPEDVRWVMALLTPRILKNATKRRQQLGLDETTLSKSRRIITKALEGEKNLTRDELRAILERSGVSTANQRSYHILWHHAHEGLICFGPPRGKQQTFVILDEWIKPTKTIDRQSSLHRLAERYFSGHGPATLKDFVWWSGLPVGDARQAIELAKDSLRQEVIDGKNYWLSSKVLRFKSSSDPLISLLPGFDEYILGYTDRESVINPIHKHEIIKGINLIFSPTIVLNGRVVGAWRREVKKNSVKILSKFFSPLKKNEREAFQSVVERYERFLGF